MESTFTPIRTSRLLLRQFHNEDLPLLYRGLSHPEVIRYYGVWFETLEDTRKQLQFFEYLETSQTGRWWAICSPDNSIFYGGCGLNNLVKTQQQAEIGFWLLPEFWGKGLMHEAAAAVCEYGFKSLDLQRIEALVERGNLKSAGLLKRLDFVFQKTHEKADRKRETFIDLDEYARNRP